MKTSIGLKFKSFCGTIPWKETERAISKAPDAHLKHFPYIYKEKAERIYTK